MKKGRKVKRTTPIKQAEHESLLPSKHKMYSEINEFVNEITIKREINIVDSRKLVKLYNELFGKNDNNFCQSCVLNTYNTLKKWILIQNAEE
jgi:hypothetical protein